jgi:uncharacterized membrane protein
VGAIYARRMESDGADHSVPKAGGGRFRGSRRERVARTDARRLESFSDGVFAIAITLLVLGLSIPKGLPESEVWSAIADQQDELISAAISFAIIGIYWVSHRSTFDRIVESDGALTAVNFLHLAAVVFLPFPTLVLAEYGNSFAAVTIYALTIAAAGYSAAATVWVARRNNLLNSDVDDDWVVARITGMVTTPSVFLVSIGVAAFNPSAAMYFWFIAFLVSPLADHLVARFRN